MKQILQNLSSGKTSVVDVPCPENIEGSLLIKSSKSIVSAGTERMLVDFGRSSLVNKARQQPDKVKMVFDKVKSDGLMPTIEAVRSKLDQPIPLGYCNAGVILESSVEGFSEGDRVVSNGGHAEVVRVAQNLCAKIPSNVDDESAAFTVLAAIGLQGIRLAEPTLGEIFVVSGLGLVGLMTVQMLKANGCSVIGIDFDSERCALARNFGATTVNLSKGEDPISLANSLSHGFGVDAVIITASTQSDDLMHQAASMCRKRARIILVGVVGLNLRRDDFFKKEITFQVSASYGPGRYDLAYEEKGQDYPIGFVRWTEQRNFEAVLELMSRGLLDVKSLITNKFKIEDAENAYDLLNDASVLGILLEYESKEEATLRSSTVNLPKFKAKKNSSSGIVVGFIGAGNYASRTLIPEFSASGISLDTLVTSTGISGVHHGEKAGFRITSTDADKIWTNEKINTVVIVTRHNLHAKQVILALESGKNVFVEKPLALNLGELNLIYKTFHRVNKDQKNSLRLMVGFNRRFAPHIIKIKELLKNNVDPKVIVMTINAGSLPIDHWTQDIKVGGGRIIGECCHFIDLMRFLIGSSITGHQSMMIGNAPGIEVRNDKVSINLSFADGSIATIHYLANGGKSFPKEKIDVFCDGAVLHMNNYRTLKSFDWPGFKKMNLFKQNKGQKECVNAFSKAINSGANSPIPFEEIIESSRIAIEVAESLR
jgi:predicted dehydrogenase/threonine dehydrogenase-like Zn-dependent dehydrogenase